MEKRINTSIDSGTYRLNLGDKQTEPIPYDATVEEIKAAIEKIWPEFDGELAVLPAQDRV